MRVSEVLSKAQWQPVPKGRMKFIAWVDGYLLVLYIANKTYILGPNVDAGELPKLLKVPYPDGLLAKLKAKHGWKSFKVEAA